MRDGIVDMGRGFRIGRLFVIKVNYVRDDQTVVVVRLPAVPGEGDEEQDSELTVF